MRELNCSCLRAYIITYHDNYFACILFAFILEVGVVEASRNPSYVIRGMMGVWYIATNVGGIISIGRVLQLHHILFLNAVRPTLSIFPAYSSCLVMSNDVYCFIFSYLGVRRFTGGLL